jgi:tetratricopeptide (TPR) repeat protein
LAAQSVSKESDMDRAILNSLVLLLVAGPAWSQFNETADNRIRIGNGVNKELTAGSTAIRAGNYDDGIRLTLRGLEDPDLSVTIRSQALSNVCGAYAAIQQPDTAIRYCTESLGVDSANWRAFSNRSYAYWLKGQYAEAKFDLDAAMALSPRARQVAQIRGMINEATLQPNIRMEDLQ